MFKKKDGGAPSAKDSHGKQFSVAVGNAAHHHARLVGSDLWHALKTQRTFQMMLALLLVVLCCWHLYPIDVLLYPFKLFVTVIHEACHAMAARFTGGQVAFISIAPDESGLTGTMGGLRPLVIMAGYLGTAIFGGLLIWWGRQPAAARSVLHSIGIVIIALTLFYGQLQIFSFISMLAIGVAIFMVAKKASDMFCHAFLMMLAVMTTLEAVISIQDLFLLSALTSGANDARSMEGITGVPAVVWSVLWGLFAIVVLFFSMWFSYRPTKKDVAEAKQALASDGSIEQQLADLGGGMGDSSVSETILKPEKKQKVE